MRWRIAAGNSSTHGNSFLRFSTGALIDECDTALIKAAGRGFIASVPPRMSTVEPVTSGTGIFSPSDTDHHRNSSDSTNTREGLVLLKEQLTVSGTAAHSSNTNSS